MYLMIYYISCGSMMLMVCVNVLDDLLYLLYEYDVDGLCKCPWWSTLSSRWVWCWWSVGMFLMIYSICSVSMMLMVCVNVNDDLLYLLYVSMMLLVLLWLYVRMILSIFSIFSVSMILMVCGNVLNDLLYLLCESDVDDLCECSWWSTILALWVWCWWYV